MDYVSHGFWSYIVFHRIRTPMLAVAFGLLPDTSSWFIYVLYRLFRADMTFGKPVVAEVPAWVFTLYNISHSLIVAAAVIVAVWLIARRVPLFMLAWPLAIVMDVLTHTSDFLPTPFLWPVSRFAFHGISWATPWLFITNWIAIAVAMAFILARRRRMHHWSAKTPLP